MTSDTYKNKAAADLQGWEELKRMPAFTNLFMRRVNEEVEKRRAVILEDRTLTPTELHEARLIYFAVLDTSKLAARDEAACRSTLGPSPD